MSAQILKQFLPGSTRVGFLGVGVMGKSIATNLINKGYKNMTVYTRTKSKADPLIELGAKLAASPKEVGANSDVVISIVGYPSDVRSVILDEENGVLSGMKEGGVIVDMTTSQPSLAVEIYNKAKEKGVYSLDAPCSGGDIGARNATLTIFVGGDEPVLGAVTPIFESIGKTINFMGESGKGQHAKMANQVIIATSMIGVCEGLLYAHKAGLDVHQTLKAVSGGAANSFSLQSYGPRILKRDFEPGFYVEHFIKDMEIVLSEANKMQLVLPGLNLAKMLYDSL
ncbi:3-hydroxyisobutyrate dehydrogenase, partial [Naegleria gruberi]